LVISLFAVSANSAPMAYSVNSDSGNIDNQDSLYLIDLATGLGQRRGTLTTGIVGDVRRDTEGLAFSKDGTLWGIDDETLTLFPINTGSGSVSMANEISVPGFPTGGGNDFGMTFSCDDTLYVTSTAAPPTLYELDFTGSLKVIGSRGALGANISAIAAIGNPTRLFGLGNGQDQNGETDSPNLYSIDPVTGVATMVGPLGSQVGEYNQGGMAFDSDGELWAITDRRIINNSIEDLPSQILRIDLETGTATVVSNTGQIDETGEVGFESLAIAPPAACGNVVVPGTNAPNTEGIPTLGTSSRLLAIVLLMLVGIAILRKRTV